jgi:hypothetical protein
VRARILLGLGILCIAFGASAEEARRVHHNVNISAGREGRLAYYASPDAACGKGIAPQISIVERPSYGKLVLRPDRLTALSYTIPARAQNCRGQFVNVTAVFYKPAKEFHGSDRVVLRINFPAADGTASAQVDAIYIAVR